MEILGPTDSKAQSSLTIPDYPPNVLRALYLAVTGRSEKISKSYTETCIIEKKDIENLCTKFDQFTNPYDCIGCSLQVIIQHENSQSHRYQSIDSFLQYDETNPNRITGIEIEFNFLIQPKKIPNLDQKNQNYKITLSIDTETGPDGDDFPVFILFRNSSVRSNIDYIDFIIARSAQTLIDDWVSSLRIVPVNKTIAAIQKKVRRNFNVVFGSTTLPTLGAIIGVYISYRLMLISGFPTTIENSVKWLMATYIITILSKYVMTETERMFVRRVVGYKATTQIVINSGDRQFKQRQESKNKYSILFASISFIVFVLHTLSAKLIEVAAIKLGIIVPIP